MSYEELLRKIQNFDAKICVVGLGQVGLPTALIYAEQGYKVYGYDINDSTINLLSQKKSPFEEEGIIELISKTIENNKFEPNTSLRKSVEQSDVIIVCVATPIVDITPNLSFLKDASISLSELNLKGKLIIIESSIPPGTFKDFVLPIISKNISLGNNFWAAYAPERLSPSLALSEIQETPRIIGQEDKKSGILAKSLYQNMVHSEIFVTSSKVAELSKLVENSYRDVNIAFANEISLICEKYKIDFAELFHICNSHPRVNLHMAGPGVGGPCLPKDPYLLLNPTNGEKIHSKIITESRKINDLMPLHISKLVTNALESQGKSLTNSTILILGVAYKGNVSDTRFSPSKEIIHDLQQKQCSVLVYDPLTDESFGGKKIQSLDEKILSNCDALVIVSDHDEFKKINPSLFQSMIEKPIIVDTKRIFNSSDIENLNMIYVSVGYLGNSTIPNSEEIEN
jgi:UDP-N-acetyl-D-mannosaminuronic acid dehydrogenase